MKNKVNKEILTAAKKQQVLREDNIDENREGVYIDSSRNISVSIGSKDLR